MMGALAVDELDLAALPDRSRHAFDLEVVSLGDGSTLRIPVNVIAGKGARPCLVAVAGIHGDEVDGVMALMDLWDEVEPDQISGRLVTVPVANPTAFAVGQRCSPLDNLDLNRIFPGDPAGQPSEQLAHRLYTSVVLTADFVFSMHGWHSAGKVLPYVEFSHHYSEISVRSYRAAVASGFEIIRISSWAPGLMTRVANEAGIPGIEAEIGGLGTTQPENRTRYKGHVIALMQHLGMLEGDAPANRNPRVVEHFDVFSPIGGLLRIRVELGTEVGKGHVLATVHDLHGTPTHKIEAPDKGLIAALQTSVAVRPGAHLFRMFRDVENPVAAEM